MSEIPVDERRDPEMMGRLKAIAAGIFARHGVDFASAKRAGGWSNATWLGGGLALRLSVEQGNQTILREARLGALLPAEAGYPPIIETGVTEGFAWSLSKQIPGRNLGEVWPTLDWDRRLLALRQLWKMVEAVHTVDVSMAAPLARKRSIFYPASREEAQTRLARLHDQKAITAHEAEALEKRLDRFWQALRTATPVLNHGDFTIENALWHEGRVVCLLDFEYAVIAPDELDLNELVKSAFAPRESADPLPDPGRTGLERMRELVLELSMPMLAHLGARDLLLGYAILLEIWATEDRLLYPLECSEAEQAALDQILGGLADGEGGYLAPVLARIGG